MKSKHIDPIVTPQPEATIPTAEETQALIAAHVTKLKAAGLTEEQALADAKAHIAHRAVLAAEKNERATKDAARAARAKKSVSVVKA